MKTEEVAEILFEQFGDGCACNYNGNDEWLPNVCDAEECCLGNGTDELFCWKQLLKHYSERKSKK